MKDDLYLRNLFALADKKKRFIYELENLPLSEFQYWVGFYEIQFEEMEKAVKHG